MTLTGAVVVAKAPRASVFVRGAMLLAAGFAAGFAAGAAGAQAPVEAPAVPPAVQAEALQASPGDADRGASLAYTCYGCHGGPEYRNA